MTSAISVTIGAAAAKLAPQASGNTQAGAAQQSQIPNAEQVATASQAAVEHGAVRIELGKEKAIRIPRRVEGTFDSQEEQEKQEISDDSEQMNAEKPATPNSSGRLNRKA